MSRVEEEEVDEVATSIPITKVNRRKRTVTAAEDKRRETNKVFYNIITKSY